MQKLALEDSWLETPRMVVYLRQRERHSVISENLLFITLGF